MAKRILELSIQRHRNIVKTLDAKKTHSIIELFNIIKAHDVADIIAKNVADAFNDLVAKLHDYILARVIVGLLEKSSILGYKASYIGQKYKYPLFKSRSTFIMCPTHLRRENKIIC